MIGILVLAAGSSTRLGSPKQLLIYQGRSLLRHAVETALSSTCRPVGVVLGAGADRLQRELTALPVQVALNPEWAQGMGLSLRVGMGTLLAGGHELDGVVVILCDQPLLSPSLIDEMVAAFHRTGSPIVACEYGSAVGVPALFSCELFPELLALDGTRGAQSLLARDPTRVQRIPFPDGEIDIDTVEDYERLNQENRGNSGYSLQHRR